VASHIPIAARAGENRPITGRLLIVVALCAAFAGCFGGSGEANKAGDASGPVTLRVATDDPADRPGSNALEELADRVREISHGTVLMQIELNAGGDGSDWDQKVARKVIAGDVDLGLVPARAWDTQGVTSLRALSAPFLVTSDALLDDVVTSDLAKQLMSGLDGTGVHGVALFPEGLRHPFGFTAPLFGPDDYRGETIRTPTSATTAAVFKALGARTVDTELDARTQAGAESAYDLSPTGIATGNVMLFAKADVLVINDDVADRLDSQQRAAIEKAAIETRDWIVRTAPGDAKAARGYCQAGGAVVLAKPADVAALKAATAPVTADLERDAKTRELIGAIRERARTVTAPPAVACGKEADARGAGVPGGADARFDGVYRFEITDRQLREAGVTRAADIAENHGIFTVTLSHGDYCWKQRAPNDLNNPDECSTYELRGARVIWNYPTGAPDVYRFAKLPDGDLKVTAVRGGTPAALPYVKVWAANVWERIGGGE
jgi:TRAP-type C4-dicarboxylate transport system substrate-binding protein